MSELTPRHVSQWVAWLMDERAQGERVAAEKRANGERVSLEPVYLADGTVARIVTVLRAIYATALAEGVVAHNPTRDVRLPKRDAQRRIAAGGDEDDEPARALTTDQLATFLAVTPERYRLLMRLLAATGLRISEATALRWADVQLDGSTPHVHVRRAYRNGVYGPPKSKYGRRRVPIPFELVTALREHRRGTEWGRDEDIVFATRNGTPYAQGNLRQAAINPTREEAGVPWAGFHTLRHTCATRLFAAGRNAVQVQRWLGHHSPAFTLSVYVHLLDGDIGEALPDPLGSARGQQSPPKQTETLEPVSAGIPDGIGDAPDWARAA